MAKLCGPDLPAELLERLRGGAFYRSGTTGLPVLTLDSAGWPHVAMAAGAVAAEPDRLWICLGSATSSLQRAEETGRVTLLIAGPDTLYYVKGEVEAVRPLVSVPRESAVLLRTRAVLQDSKPFLRVTGGISYAWNVLPDEYQTVIDALLDELTDLAKGGV